MAKPDVPISTRRECPWLRLTPEDQDGQIGVDTCLNCPLLECSQPDDIDLISEKGGNHAKSKTTEGR